MRRFLLFGLIVPLLVLAGSSCARAAEQPARDAAESAQPAWTGRCIEELQHNTRTAEWLLEYDRQAWESSDVVFQQPQEVLSKLTSEWFCRERDKRWICYYGRYDDDAGEFEVVVQLERNEAGAFAVRKEVDRDPGLVARARALRGALERMPAEIRNLGVTFNQYVRARDDGALEVWLLPAWQQDGTAVYGAELAYTFSADGREPLDRHEIPGPMRGIRPDPETTLHLDNRARPCPTVGSVFFLLLHRNGFERILIHSDGAVSTLAETEDGQAAWLHAVDDEDGEDGKGPEDDGEPEVEAATTPPPA